MIYKFRIISGEKEDFLREIEISSHLSFFDLHQIIQRSCSFDDTQIASFFLSNDDWEKGREITLFDMDESQSSDKLVMDKAILEDYIKDEKQKVIYVFDFFSERGFFIELSNVYQEDHNAKHVVLSASAGDPPEQLQFNLDMTEDFVDGGYSWDEESDDDEEGISFENIDDFDDL